MRRASFDVKIIIQASERVLDKTNDAWLACRIGFHCAVASRKNLGMQLFILNRFILKHPLVGDCGLSFHLEKNAIFLHVFAASTSLQRLRRIQIEKLGPQAGKGGLASLPQRYNEFSACAVQYKKSHRRNFRKFHHALVFSSICVVVARCLDDSACHSFAASPPGQTPQSRQHQIFAGVPAPSFQEFSAARGALAVVAHGVGGNSGNAARATVLGFLRWGFPASRSCVGFAEF